MQNQFDALRPAKKESSSIKDVSGHKDNPKYSCDMFKFRLQFNWDVLPALNQTNSIEISPTERLIGLMKGQAWSFFGKCNLECLKGKVSVYGYELSPGSPSIPSYSPSTHSPVCIVALEAFKPNIDSSVLDIGDESFNNFVNSPFDAVIRIRSFPSDNFIEILLKRDIYKPPSYAIEAINGVYTATSTAFPLFIPDEWSNIVDNFDDLPSIAVCGSKNVGKSTFGRVLVNLLLKKYPKVAYLETDVGQTEHTPSCVLSLNIIDTPLIGPPISHMNIQNSRCFGFTTPEKNPMMYFEKIAELYEDYKYTCSGQGIPLIVNTHGWIRGLGVDLVHHILQLVRPKTIVQFAAEDSNGNINPLDIVFNGLKDQIKSEWWLDGKTYVEQIQLDSWKPHQILYPPLVDPSILKSKPPAFEYRNLALIYYFEKEQTLIKPVEISINVLEFGMPGSSIDTVLDVYNMSVIALIYKDDNNTERMAGIGIVRAVNMEKKTLLILTPCSMAELNERKVCKIEKLDHDVPAELVDYFSKNSNAAPYVEKHVIDGMFGHTFRKTRRNLLRKYHQKK